MSHRAAVAGVLAQVIGRGRSLDRALPADAGGTVRALCYETLRLGPRLNFLAEALLNEPPRPRDADVTALILTGLYELEYTQTPAYAAVDGAVAAARERGKPWAAKLINAVLRRYQRERAQLLAAVENNAAAKYAHPDWLLALYQQDWPADWQTIVAANNAKGPMWLRVNQARLAAEAYLEQLRAAGIEATPHAALSGAICLKNAVNVGELPGFAKGWVSVQDAGAQWAARLLEPQSGARVLDACAAPGNKSAHLLERHPNIEELVAVDNSEQRLETLKANLARLQLTATIRAGDARRPGDWWDGREFDCILLDAPCSGSGVVRRHPDIKWLKRERDLEQLTQTQSSLLEALWPLLKPGGQMLYVTCSVFEMENAARIAEFTPRIDDASELDVDARFGRAQQRGRQCLPGEDGMDGFYYARLAKTL